MGIGFAGTSGLNLVAALILNPIEGFEAASKHRTPSPNVAVYPSISFWSIQSNPAY